MVLVVERVGEDVVAEIAAVLRELLVGERLVAADELAGDARARAALAEPVLDRLHLHVVPVGEEGGEDPAVVRHVAVPVRGALPDAHRREMRRLQRRDVPLVHAVVGDAVQPHLAARPRLHARPLDAVVEVLRLARREVIDETRRAAGAARIHAHARVAVGHPLLRVDDFPALVEVARAAGDVGMLGDHALPGARVAVLEGEALRVRAVGEDHRVAALGDRTEHVGAQDEAVVHRDRHVPVDAHAVADFGSSQPTLELQRLAIGDSRYWPNRSRW